MSLSVLFKHTSSRAAGDAGRAFELGSAEWKCSLTVEGPARPGREHPSGGGGGQQQNVRTSGQEGSGVL